MFDGSMISGGQTASSWETSSRTRTVDVSATYPLSTHVSLDLNISNVFNDRHWETFGGAPSETPGASQPAVRLVGPCAAAGPGTDGV